MDRPTDTIAGRINQVMEILQMKPADIVKSSGISKSSLSYYMAGKLEPKQKNLCKIAKALRVSEQWLQGYDVPMEAEKKIRLS